MKFLKVKSSDEFLQLELVDILKAIDAVDNGVNQYNTDKLPSYINNTHLSARVGKLNPDWMEPNAPEIENKAFAHAMELAGREFLEVRKIVNLLIVFSNSLLYFNICLLSRSKIQMMANICLLELKCS